MKVIVLGGAGDMGSEAARDLASRRVVGKVIIADANRRRAEKLCEEIGRKAEFVRIDALNNDQVAQTMKSADVALSCLGPFYKFEEKMVRAAMAARVNYVSICDDFDAAEATLAMDKEIRQAGIAVLSGMGWTPGLSNVLARKGMNTLDTTRRINIYWAGSVDDSEGLAVIKHTLHIFNGKAPIFQGGRWKHVDAGSGEETVAFPEPIGDLPVSHLGHPEPITIPHFFKELEEVTLKGGVAPPWLSAVARGMSRFKFTNTAAKRDRAASVFHGFAPMLGKTGAGMSAIRVDVHGEKGGAPAQLVYTAVDNMRRLTGIPAAIGAIMLGSGAIEGKGFLAPEVAVDPDAFLAELSKRKVKVTAREES
jgi:saccharopine dehydrogenase-like NADP-dependent oxidoreductase